MKNKTVMLPFWFDKIQKIKNRIDSDRDKLNIIRKEVIQKKVKSPEYSNRGLLLENRKMILNKNTYCGCGEQAKHLHHIDKTKTNHSLNNLIPLCRKCHYVIHHP